MGMELIVPIILAVLSFFASGGANKEKRGKAALTAAAVGGGSYYVANHTDWGKNAVKDLDSMTFGKNDKGEDVVVRGPGDAGKPIVSEGTDAGASTSGSNGLWTTLGGWLNSPAGQVTTGAAGAKAVGMPSWLVWGGVALGAYLILK